MAGDQDPEAGTPDAKSSRSSRADEYYLTDVLRGRMFCITHGRECYRRNSAFSEGDWVCPDERHENPIRIS